MCWAWVLSWQMAMDKINTFTMNTFTPSTKGKLLGQHACIGRVAQGKRGETACVCWVCLKKWTGKYKPALNYRRDRQMDTQRSWL